MTKTPPSDLAGLLHGGIRMLKSRVRISASLTGKVRIIFEPKLIEYDWALHPSAVNKSINLGTTNAQRIDLALKIRSRDVISTMICLTTLKIVAELQCH